MSEVVQQLDPAKVQADENIRYNLKDTAIEALAESILSEGRVLEPVGVEVLSPPVNGFTHRLIFGFIRHAAVKQLNATQNAGLTLPALVLTPADATARLKTQVAENVQRENMSPMDRAVAAKKLMDSGVSRQEVRRIFSSPGGRKGTPQPLSNAMLNIMLKWLELPKAMQQKIHAGLIGVAAAYELSRVPPDKRAAVLEAAEAERLRAIAKEEADEDRFLKAEQKLGEALTERKEADQTVEQIKESIVQASILTGERTKELKDAQSVPYLELSDDQKKLAVERIKAAQANLKGALKEEKKVKNELARALSKAKTAAETAIEVSARLEQARKLAKASKGSGRKKEVGAQDVKKAAAAVGVGGSVPLALADIKSGIKDIAGCKDYPQVAAIGQAIKHWLDGRDTPKEVCHNLAILTGELAPPTPAPAPAPAPVTPKAPVKAAKK